MQIRESIRLSAAAELALEMRQRPPQPMFSARDIMDGVTAFAIVFVGAMLFLL